ALLYVACVMTRGLAEIEWEDITEYAPAVVAAVTMPLTYSIATGIGLGFITYALAKLIAGKFNEAKPAVGILAVIFAIKVALPGKPGRPPVQSITATALISTRQRGSVASRTTCTVVVAGLASRKYSPHTRLSASWSERSVTKRSAVTTSAKVAPTASRPRFKFSSAARAWPAISRGMASNSSGRCGWWW